MEYGGRKWRRMEESGREWWMCGRGRQREEERRINKKRAEKEARENKREVDKRVDHLEQERGTYKSGTFAYITFVTKYIK